MLLVFPSPAAVFCPMDKMSSSVQGHGHHKFKLLQHACGKGSSSAICTETGSISWCTESEVCVSHHRRCRHLVSVLAYLLKNVRLFFGKRFWTLLLLTVLVQAGNWTENFKSKLDKALQLRAEIQTVCELKPSVPAPANGFLPQWLTKGWDH